MKVKVAFGSDIRIWRKKVENFNSLVSFVENSFEQLNEDFLITYEVTILPVFFLLATMLLGVFFFWKSG